jgi:hypothetical protein
MMGSESLDGVTIATAHFLPPSNRPKDEPVNRRHNFSPSAAQVGDSFILGSSLGLTRDLVRALKGAAGPASGATVVAEADGDQLAQLIAQNKTRLVDQNMLEKGNDKAKAEQEVGFLENLVRQLNHATLTARDLPDGLRLRADFQLLTK